MDIPKIDIFTQNAATSQERYARKNYPEFHDYIIDKYKDTELTWSEMLYCYYHNLINRPVCRQCGRPVKFINLMNGYREYCSARCAGSSEAIKQKKIETCRRNFGTDFPMQSKAVRSKSEQTCQTKYGVNNAAKTEQVKLKIKTVCQERYGVNAPMQSEAIKEKSRQTCIEKYGVEYNTQNKDILNKAVATARARYGGVGNESSISKHKHEQTCQERYGENNYSTFIAKQNHDDLLFIDGNDWVMRCPHSDCDKCELKLYKITGEQYRARVAAGTELCTTLLPIGTQRSTQELQICQWLDDVGVVHEDNLRTYIKDIHGKELDIYIPDRKLAIEVNGCYTHSDKCKRRNEQEWKYIECKKNGIQLIQIWEDWMRLKPEICKSLIFAKLGIFEHRTGASKCKIQTVDKKTAQEFLEQNHIQGRCGCQINYGLYYKGALVSLMTFGKRRPGMGGKTATEGQYELLRFCNLKGWQVVHGAERMLHHFIQDYHPKEIISFSSNDISDGSLYCILGFTQSDNIEHSYWYIEPNTYKRYHRFSFNKFQILEKGLAPDPDPSKWTEREAMDAAGYYRIYDSGTTKWTLKLK